MRAMPAVSRMLSLGFVAVAAACSGNPGPSATAPQAAPASGDYGTPRASTPAPAAVAAPTAVPATPPPTAAAATTPSASAIDMTGSWSGSVDVQGQTIGLDMNLAKAASGGYTGDVAPQGQPPAQLKSLTLDGNHLVMVFDAPDGEATFDMMISADRQAFTGNISYQGQTIPFTARKRP